jgi:competence protein ComEC
MGVSMMRERLGWRVTRMAMCWALGVVILGASSLAYRALERRWLRVDILDVGHGDSIVLRTPGGRTLLVDAGSREAGQFVVVPFLRAAGIGTVDALILTHPDEDHLGGAIPLLHAVRVRQLLTNGVRDDTMSARELRRVAAAQGIPEHVLSAGMAISDAPDVHLDVLHPPRGLVSGVAPASNDNSVILKVTKGLVSVLLTGDIEEDGLPQLSQQGSMLRSTVLKVPHHGSRLGRAGELFFDAVHAQVAVLSVGRVHRLPARETLEALSQRGTRLYLTRDHGAVSLRTGGQHLMVRTFRTKQQSVVAP